MKIDELMLYKAAFKTIENNIEWGLECDDRFAWFVNGVLALFDSLKQEIGNLEEDNHLHKQETNRGE